MAQNPTVRLEHLLTSLSELIEREEMLEKDDLLAEAEEVRQRMLSLMDAITPLTQELQHREMMSQKLRDKLNAIATEQRRIFDQRAKKMQLVQVQINELKSTGAKLKSVRPAYGKATSPIDASRSLSLDAEG